jgi:hypothetical protein
MRFEKVSDVEDDFCHLDVFFADESSARIDVSLDENREVIFSIYPSDQKTVITSIEWAEIRNVAIVFAEKEIMNEEAFKNME